jgi:hypothetical protein
MDLNLTDETRCLLDDLFSSPDDQKRYRLNNLIDILLNMMASFQTTVSRKYKERLFEQRKEQQTQLKTVIDDLDSSVFSLILEIRNLADSVSLSDSQKISEIRLLLDRGKTQYVRAYEK